MSRIVVKNLPSAGLTEDEIRKHFSDIDDITDIKLKHNEFGASRRFAFIGFKSKEGADKAIEKLSNSYIRTSKLSIEPCKSIKEIKPDRVQHKSKEEVKNSREDENEPDEDANRKKKPKLTSEKRKQIEKEVLEEVQDDPSFKEFLSLQRNIGDKGKVKQIWADDIDMNPTDAAYDGPVNDNSNDTNSEVKQEGETTEEKPKKKHKRGKRKKKSEKTKPKELFVHTLKATGFPETVKRKDIIEFFKPAKLLSVRICKRDEVCYASFKDESDLKFALRKNLHFWQTNRIKIMKHNVNKSRIFKETARAKLKERDDNFKNYEKSLAETDPIEETGRLFVRNLSYTCTHDDLHELFSQYGDVTEVHFPIDKTTSLPKGFAYVEYMFPKDAIKAYEELNGTIFQGRNFHIIPSKPKPERTFNSLGYNQIGQPGQVGLPSQPSLLGKTGEPSQQPLLSQPTLLAPQPDQPITADNDSKSISTIFPQRPINASSFKRDKLRDQKETAPREAHKSNWNILFLGQNAVADVMSEQKNVEKSKLLTEHDRKNPLAVRMALGDASIVEQTRKFLISNGIELDSFDNPQTARSRNVMIVKNLPSSTNKFELNELFERYGKISQIIMPPKGLTAIVEMEEAVDAKIAFKKIAYSRFKDTILYLEWAPINVFREKSLEDQEQKDTKQLQEAQTGTKILVKNIPFEATPLELRKIFAAHGELNFVRIPKKLDGQHRGFGFVDFLVKEDALRAFQSLCHSTHLYGRKLVLEWAKTNDTTNGSKSNESNVNNKNNDNNYDIHNHNFNNS